MSNLLAAIRKNLSADPEPMIQLMLERAHKVWPDEYQIDREEFNQALNRLAGSDTLFRLWLVTHQDQIREAFKKFCEEKEANGLQAEADRDRSQGEHLRTYGFN